MQMQLSDNDSPINESDRSSHDSGFERSPQAKDPANNDAVEINCENASRLIRKFDDLLPEANQISNKHYSLEPDMAFGWIPKVNFTGPIQLTFKNHINDQISNYLLEEPDFKLVYLGFRPSDSLVLHREYSSPETYTYKFEALMENPRMAHLLPLVLKHKPVKERPFHGMNGLQDVKFDANFEGGNLDLVVKVREQEFDLFMRVDSNTRGHLSWYNFRVTGLKAKTKYKFNICNFTKAKCLYSKGMKPFISLNGGPWAQGGQNVTYKEEKLRYTWVEYSRRYYNLSFEIQSSCEDDIYQMAYCVPYDYSKVLAFLREFIPYEWCQQSKLCKDLSGVEVPMLTITDPDEENNPIIERKIAIIQARIHPGETNGSWMMDGFLQYLLKPESSNLKRRCILKIIPMVNPDGVVLGNYRTGMAGRDLNREFIEADQVLYPVVHAIKKLVAETHIQYGDKLVAFIDMHGHSVKKNVFIYGPEFSIWDPKYIQCRILPKLLDEKTPMFRYYSSIFRISGHKKSTARGVFYDLHEIVNCFTVEASHGFYYDQEKKQNYPFIAQDWIKMVLIYQIFEGFTIGQTFDELLDHMEAIDKLMRERANQRKEKDSRKTSLAKVRQKKIKSKNTSSMLNLHTVQEEQGMNDFLSQIEKDYKDTPLQRLMLEIQEKKPQKQSDSEEDSEGRSDSESSQDDDDRMVNQVRRQILKDSNNAQTNRKKKRKKQQSQDVNSSKQKRQIDIFKMDEQSRTVLAINKQQVSRMSFGMQVFKQPLPSLPNSRQQQARKRMLTKPNFQIITKNYHTGSLTTGQDNPNLYISHLSHTSVPNSTNNHNIYCTEYNALMSNTTQKSSMTAPHTSRQSSRFRSEQVLIAKNQIEDNNDPKQQQQHQLVSISSKSSNICPQLRSISPHRDDRLAQTAKTFHPNEGRQFIQPTFIERDERFHLKREIQMKEGKTSYPAAFYSIKKHLLNRKKPQVEDSSNMVIKVAQMIPMRK